MLKTVTNVTPLEHAAAMGIDLERLPPLALHDGEQTCPITLQRQNGKTYTGKIEAAFLVEVGVIDEQALTILQIVNKYRIISVHQIEMALALLGVSDINRNNINVKIKKLMRYGFLDAVRFRSGESKSGYILAVGSNGYFWLKANVTDPPACRISYFKTMQPEKIKKSLCSNQLVLQLLESRGVSVLDYRKGQVITDDKSAIRPDCVFTVGDTRCIVEPVRRKEKWQEKLGAKLSYYRKLLTSESDELNAPLTDATIILVAEDAEHCEQVLKIAARARYKNILVTCDQFTFVCAPDAAFFAPEAERGAFLWLKRLFKKV